MSEWQLTGNEIRLGQEAYLRYIGGVAIINTPDSEFSRGLLGGDAHESPERALAHAEQLIYQGLRGVILQANPPEWRSDLQKHAEHNYNRALPHMHLIVDSTYHRHPARIESINPALMALRPAPIIGNEPIYHNICHGRKGKLYTEALMDGFNSSSLFGAMLHRRTLVTDSTSTTFQSTRSA